MERQDQRTGRHRVVEVFGAAYGSGYAIGDQLVLTARHLLSPAGDRPQRVQVRVAGEPDFRGATVVWARRGAGDAALLAVDDAPWAGTPDSGAVRWGRILEFDAAVPVRARGFPAVQAARRGEQEVRELATVRGAVETMSPDTKRYEITVESGVPLLPGDGGSPWSGLSGAAVMDARKRIVGVVVAHRMRYGGAVLQATPVERLFTDPEFLRHAGTDESRLEDVTAQRSVPLDARGDGSILKTVAAPPSLIGLEDYELLQAGNEAVGFLGRDDQRRDLLAWCAADEHVSLGLVAGAGGAGKTRLGIQLCRDLTERGWSAGFADENILDEVLRSHVVDVVWPTLLVLDYPDRLSRRVITWITGLGARRYGPKLRFLLLDRVPGDEAARADLTWWAGVKRIPFISRPSITVRLRSGGLSHEERLRHRDAARRAFSGGTADLSRLDLRDDAYGNPLKVHVAVLLAVHGDRYPTAGDLMASFLDREMEHWQERLAAHRIHDIGFTQARQVLALATLTRPEIDVVPELLPAIRQLSDADGVRRGNLGNWLAELFGTGSRIAALEPDLLAEELLASTPELPDLVVAIHGLAACTTEHTATMLDALNLAAGNRDEVRTALGNLLVSCLGPLVTRAAAEPAGRLPGLIGAALDRVGADAGAALAAGAAVIRRVPRREESYRLMTTRLARLAIAWCDAQPPHAPTGPVRADALTDLAAASGAAADAAEALAVARTLGPEQTRRLARAWYNVGTGPAGGDRRAARDALTRAADLARQDGGTDTAALIERCDILINLGHCLAGLGDQAAALDVCVEAITLRAGQDFAGHLLRPLAGPLTRLASNLRDDPGPGGALGTDPAPRPLAGSEPEHTRWTAGHSTALITLAARLSSGLADRYDSAGAADLIAVSDALRALEPHLSGQVLLATLAESAGLRRRSVTDDPSRAAFATFLSTIAGELADDDDEAAAGAALTYATEAITEFQRLGPESFARYEADFAEAVLVRVAALASRGEDPLRLTPAQRQWALAEVDEAAALLRVLPTTPESAAALAEVSTIQGLLQLGSGEVGAAARILTEARDLIGARVSDDNLDEFGMLHVLVELLEGRQPYDWLTSMSATDLASLDPDALPVPQQAMLAVADDIDEGLGWMSGMLAASGRAEVALRFAHQLVALARFGLRVDDDTDPEVVLALVSGLAHLSTLQLGTPEQALLSAREAVDVLASSAASVSGAVDEPMARALAELALARASLAVDQRADVVDLAESATTGLAAALTFDGEDGAGGLFARWPSLTAMRADAQTVLANAYLAVDRPADAVAQAVLARAGLEGLPPSNPVVATMLTAVLVEAQGEFTRGRYDVALTAFDHVIEGFEASELTVAELPGLADAMFMSAVCLQELGRPAEALPRSRQAADLWQDAPAAHPRVAGNLIVQAMALSVLGEADEAYRMSRKALTAARATQVAASLVTALRVHAHCVSVLGRAEEAVALFDEALAASDGVPGVPPVERGLIHLGRGNCRAALGQVDAARDAFLTAATILRELPDQIMPLAGVLISAARCHRELGDNRAGLPLAAEAAGRCRALIVDEGSAAALAEVFVAALWEVVVGQDTEGDGAAADTAAVEGIEFFRAWGFAGRAEITESTLHYADLLTYHAAVLGDGGRDLDALPFGAEAIRILEALVALDRDAFLPAYLNALAGQLVLLHNLGRTAEAGAVEREYARWAPA